MSFSPNPVPDTPADGATCDVIRKRRRGWLITIWVLVGLVIAPPLAGLAGTALAMIEAFARLSESGETDPELLAGAISTALRTTAWGLAFSAVAFTGLVAAMIRFFTLPRLPTHSLTPSGSGSADSP